MKTLLDQSELLGLGDVVDARAAIPRTSRTQIVDALTRYVPLAGATGAERVTLIGTEPLRRATNADRVAAEVHAATGLMLHVVSVRQEAILAFIGVTGGRPPAESLIVVDIGGGSTELSLYVPGRSLDDIALPIGSARLTNSIVGHDPPTEQELDALHDAADSIRAALPSASATFGVHLPRAVFVGGTATNVARMGRLTPAALKEDRQTLARLSAAEVVDHFGVRPRRARQLAAGAAIVDVLLDHFGLQDADVSEASLRDGAIIVALRYGGEWPDRLEELLRGEPGQAPDLVASSSH